QLFERHGTEQLSADELFDLALAYWGKTGEMPETLCQLALERDQESRKSGYIHSQRKSLLFWLIGHVSDATRLLNEAEELVGGGEHAIRDGQVLISNSALFSLWRYQWGSAEV